MLVGMAVYLLATLDTKGPEAAFVRDRLLHLGVNCVLVDCGSRSEPTVQPVIPRSAVFEAAGPEFRDALTSGDRGQAVNAAAAGAAKLVEDAFQSGRVDGVLAIGGSAGTTIGTAAMRHLPIGVPKLMVSTLASGQVRGWVGDKDILMLNSVVDIAGLNRISRRILDEAAAAMAGMVQHRSRVEADDAAERPLIAATMFGVTTPCVQHARQLLEQAGYEVLVFHATGSGGQAMESLIREGLIAGVLDITTTELADELVGGILTAGPTRLTAAAESGIPQVLSVGALDMVNFGPRTTVPQRFTDRKFHIHNASVTLMRTTPEENAQLGAEIARKVSASQGPATILMPRRGISAIDATGQPFDDPIARDTLFTAIKDSSAGQVKVIDLDLHINDPAFAEQAAKCLLEMLAKAPVTSS